MGRPLRRITSPFAVLLVAGTLLGSLTACDDADADRDVSSAASAAPTVTDSAGVRMVSVRSDDQPFPDSLVETLRIAPADSGLGMFSFVSASTVATNGHDRIYLLDQEASQVVVFDTTGQPLDRWGRRGGGPGEFEYSDGIVVNADGSVEIFDFARAAQVRFSADGDPLPLRRFPRDSAGSSMGVLAAWRDTAVYGRRRQSMDSVTREFVLTAGGDTTVVASQTIPVTANVEFESCPVRLRGMEPYFSAPVSAARGGDALWVQQAATWRVERYTGGTLTSVWTRDTPPRATTVDMLERELENGFRMRFNGNSCEVPTAEVRQVIGMTEQLPALRRVAVAPDGTLWAERFEPKLDPQRVDVVAPDGRYLGTIVGRGAPLAFLRGGRVLYRDEDPGTGLTDLVVYRVPGATW